MFFQILQVVSAALVPVLTGAEIGSKVAVGSFGAIAAVTTAIISLYKFQERWIQYRSTCETLKHEKYLYVTGVAPYDQEDRFSLLVHRVEALISKEHSRWAEKMAEAANRTLR